MKGYIGLSRYLSVWFFQKIFHSELFYEGTEAKLGEQDILTVAEFSELKLTGLVKSERSESRRGCSYKFEAAVSDGTVETDAGQKELIIKKDGKYTSSSRVAS